MYLIRTYRVLSFTRKCFLQPLSSQDDLCNIGMYVGGVFEFSALRSQLFFCIVCATPPSSAILLIFEKMGPCKFTPFDFYEADIILFFNLVDSFSLFKKMDPNVTFRRLDSR